MSNSPSVRVFHIPIHDFTRQDTVNRVLVGTSFGLCGLLVRKPCLVHAHTRTGQVSDEPGECPQNIASTLLRRCNSLPRGFGQPRPLPAKSAACGDSASEAKEVKKLGGTTHESVRVCWDVVKHCPSPPVGLRRASRKIARSDDLSFIRDYRGKPRLRFPSLRNSHYRDWSSNA